MTLRFMMVEDIGHRMDTMETLCRPMRNSNESVQFAATRDDARIQTLNALRDITAADLAEVDAVFIDFDLVSQKVPGFERWKPLELSDGTTFKPVTGMSCLIYFTDLMTTEAYKAARRKRSTTLTAKEVTWLSSPHMTTRLFSFVETRDRVSRLFVGASALWFGAVHQSAQPDVVDPEQRQIAQLLLRTPIKDRLNGADRLASQAKRWAPFVDSWLRTNPVRGKGWSVIDGDGHWPSRFDLYRIYLQMNGNMGLPKYSDPSGFRDAFFAITNHPLTSRRADPEGTANFFDRLQTPVGLFDNQTALSPVWDKWSAEGADPLYEYLRDTALFWESSDVRLACERYVQAKGAHPLGVQR